MFRNIIIFFAFLFFVVDIKAYDPKIPTLVLCFHDINGNGRYSIQGKDFVTILDLFKNRYHVISLKDWYGLNQKGKKKHFRQNIAKKPYIVLTFDDGFPSLFSQVIPLLNHYNYGATFFIYLDRHAAHSVFYKNLSELPDKFEIGSHSFSHSLLRYNSERLFEEIYLSRKKLEYLVKREVISWAWPYGRYSQKLLEQAENAGYLLQVSVDSTIIKADTSYNSLARFTVQQPDPVKQVKEALKIYRREFKEFLNSNQRKN